MLIVATRHIRQLLTVVVTETELACAVPGVPFSAVLFEATLRSLACEGSQSYVGQLRKGIAFESCKASTEIVNTPAAQRACKALRTSTIP